MGFSIQDFKAELSDQGTMRSTHGQLIFSAPQRLPYSDITSLLIRCDQLSLPGVFLTTDDQIKRYGYGPIQKAPHLALFDPFQASFVVDRNAFMYRFFYDWMSLIVNFNSSGGIRPKNQFDMLPYEASYHDDYVTELFILVYDEQTNQVMQYQLTDGYPQAISETPMSWGDLDGYVRLNITFQYKDWAQQTSDGSNFRENESFLGPIQNVVGLNTNISALVQQFI